MWPFVQSYWALAAAKAGNEAAVTESMAAIYRPAALFLTNKENFVARNGDFAGTQINSSNMLWSLSGSLSLVYKVLFGMQYQGERLVFRPFVPAAFAGHRRLENFRYRRAILDIEMDGSGNSIASITMDGAPLPDAAVSGALSGRHAIKITLAAPDAAATPAPVTRVANRTAPEMPAVTFVNGRLRWPAVEGAGEYLILKNGKLATTIHETEYVVPAEGFAAWQVIAVDDASRESFASEPLELGREATGGQQVQLETVAGKSALPYKGYSGKGFIETTTTKNNALSIPVTVSEAGLYALDFRYANGNGPLNTNNRCAVRTLRRGSELLGTVVLPQRGVAEWSNWGFSNPILVRLEKGSTRLQLAYEPANQNMNIEVNQAMLDYLRLRRVE